MFKYRECEKMEKDEMAGISEERSGECVLLWILLKWIINMK